MIRFIGVFLIGLLTASFFSFDGVQEVKKIFRQACAEPLSYRIGTIDPSFGLSEDKLREALADVEKLWEADGQDLFVYSETGSVVINFVYDERQQRTGIERELRRLISEKHTEVTDIQQNYTALSAQYEEALVEYEARRNTYESTLATYNATIEKWNKKGGAPADVYATLGEQRTELEKEADSLRSLSSDLNRAVELLNGAADKANTSADEYNTVAGQYNVYFHEDKLFTQGDYQQQGINIYQYDGMEEMRIVLAHELGHALGLGHVDGDTSIMNSITRSQSFTQGLSQEDTAHLAEVCRFEK